MKRTITVSIQHTPAISGYGGFDEWTLENMEPEAIDYFLERLDALVKGTCKREKVEGGFTGAT